MKIKSITDVITNSSSECFQIKNKIGMSEEEFRKKWNEILVSNGIFSESGECLDEFCKGRNLDYTLKGEIYSENDELYLDYPVMCNLDLPIEKILGELFGKENIVAI